MRALFAGCSVMPTAFVRSSVFRSAGSARTIGDGVDAALAFPLTLFAVLCSSTVVSAFPVGG
jgi:hypothetical protein